MRICHVTDAADASYGGLYTATQGLVRALSHAPGIDSIAIAGDGADCWSADLCHAHGMWSRSAWTTLAWQLRNGKPLILAPHGMLDEWALRRSRVAKKIALASYEGLRLRRAKCIHALCEAELASVQRLGLSTPAFVIPNGVDLPSLQEVERSRRLGRDGKPRTLLYLGRVHAKKGLDLVLRGLAELARRDRNLRSEWRLRVCGPGDARYIEELARMAGEMEIAHMVDFAGPVHGDDKRRALEDASAFVLTSYSEGLPMSVLEAWAYGLASVISTECNLTAPAASGAAILTSTSLPEVTARLGDLMTLSDNDRRDIGLRAREYIERVHRWDRVRDRMIELYQWALGSGPRPEPA